MSDLLTISERPSFEARLAERLRAASRATRLPWHDDPAGFCRDCIKWPKDGLTPYQEDVMDAMARVRRVAVRSLHGARKTTTSALIVLWFAVTRDAAGIDWKVVTTAGAWRQLERYLWPEIKLWARRLRFEKLGRPPFNERDELLTLMLKLRHGQAFAVAATDASLIEGAHGEEILYVFDESKAIEPDIFDAAEGAFATGVAYALAVSTPGEPVGRFYDIHARRPGFEDWWTRHITLQETIDAGVVNEAWVEQRRKQWGESSAIFQNRVLGEFASSDEDGVIPLAWVEAANQRWLDMKPPNGSWPEMERIGVDVARSGADDTVIACKHGDVIGELRYSPHGEDTMATSGRVYGLLQIRPSIVACIDTDGLGAGVTDRVREQAGDRRVHAFHAGASTDRKDVSGELGFVNVRSAAWWHLRQLLDPSFSPTLCLPPDDRLTGELTSPKWRVMSNGRLAVESKDDIKKRLGRSTDAADAVIMAVWNGAQRRGVMTYAGRARGATTGLLGRVA